MRWEILMLLACLVLVMRFVRPMAVVGVGLVIMGAIVGITWFRSRK